MGFGDIFFFASTVIGGLALFIFGMSVMTDALREAAGQRLKNILTVMTARRWTAFGLGTLFGGLVHSTATVMMVLGFVQAGLMTLVQAVPVIFGANVGTTFAMQAISFRLGDYALFAVAVGFLINMFGRGARQKKIGMALIGFGLLFLGMMLISDAIKPHREALKPILAGISADSLSGLLKGILMSVLLTAVIQSSGATIAMCFALTDAGVFTDVAQTMPIILGAHIGTCSTALIASIGVNNDARRTAFTHLIFNLFNVTLACLLRGPIIWMLETLNPIADGATADVLAEAVKRQSANLHTLAMTLGALVLLPFTALFAKMLTRLIRGSQPDTEASYLDDNLLDYPEKAISACIRELQRVARICGDNFHRVGRVILFAYTNADVHTIQQNEQVINEVKVAMKDYLARLTRRYLSKRQAILVQHVSRCMVDLERIGDHLEDMCEISLHRKKNPEALVRKESFDMMFSLYESALHIFHLVVDSLDADSDAIQPLAQEVLAARSEYVQASADTRAHFRESVSKRIISPIAGIAFSEYFSCLDRIVRHTRSIALAETEPQFWIKRTKLNKQVPRTSPLERVQLVDPRDYLSRIGRKTTPAPTDDAPA